MPQIDARAPLFEYGLVLNNLNLNPPTNLIQIWLGGSFLGNYSPEELAEWGQRISEGWWPVGLLGNDFALPKKPKWSLANVGMVVKTIASRIIADGDAAPAIFLLYGSSPRGPANPDSRTAGLLIDETSFTIKWVQEVLG